MVTHVTETRKNRSLTWEYHEGSSLQISHGSRLTLHRVQNSERTGTTSETKFRDAGAALPLGGG